jgi:predicted Zn-dependent protease
MVQKYGFMKNSQEDELESDRVGFRYAVNTNYDKNNVGDFYQKLFTLEQQSKKNQNGLMSSLSDAMSSHPPSKDRIRQAEEMKELIKVNGKTTTTSEFFRMKKLAQELVSQHQKK